MKNSVDAWLATNLLQHAPDFILINIGANGWITSDVSYTMDAIHAQWPFARVLLCRVGSRGAPTTFFDDADIPSLISTRSSWSGLGPDERITLEGGDNYTTNTYDGQHYSAAGAAAMAAAWKVSMGF